MFWTEVTVLLSTKIDYEWWVRKLVSANFQRRAISEITMTRTNMNLVIFINGTTEECNKIYILWFSHVEIVWYEISTRL